MSTAHEAPDWTICSSLLLLLPIQLKTFSTNFCSQSPRSFQRICAIFHNMFMFCSKELLAPHQSLLLGVCDCLLNISVVLTYTLSNVYMCVCVCVCVGVNMHCGICIVGY
jgi:hypothetical protein